MPAARERRLRAHLKYARMSVAMALAESQHHSAQRQKTARAGEWERVALHGRVLEEPTSSQEPGTQHFVLDDDGVPLGGSRPDRLPAVSGPQERGPRRIVEQKVHSAPVVPLLHAPEPQLVDSVVEVRKILDNLLLRAGHRSAQDHSAHCSSALLSPGATDGRTVGGVASVRLRWLPTL